MTDTHMTIGEVARWANVPTSTLRYYESIGILPAPKRLSGQRRYSSDILPILAIIQLAKDATFTLPEIKHLLCEFPQDIPLSQRFRQIARDKLTEIETLIRDAQAKQQLLQEALENPYLQRELDATPLPNFDDTDTS